MTAAERGISDGQWVRVDTRTGSVRLRARIDESLHRNVVIAEYGWWQADPDLGLAGLDPLSADGSNFNLLIDDENIDPISGSIPLRSFTCQVTAEPADHSWQGTRTFLVEAADTVSRDVRTVHLVPEDGAQVPDYRAGQHITLRSTIPGDGESVERSYSLIGPARKNGRDGYRLAVRRAPLGRFSGYVHDTLEVRDRIEIGSPAGLFVVPTDIDTPVVMMAGGIGITPFLSYLETIAATGGPCPNWCCTTVSRTPPTIRSASGCVNSRRPSGLGCAWSPTIATRSPPMFAAVTTTSTAMSGSPIWIRV